MFPFPSFLSYLPLFLSRTLGDLANGEDSEGGTQKCTEVIEMLMTGEA